MLKLTRWIKGESSEVSRLRADTYDELKELDIVEYTESYWKNLPIGFEYVQRKGQSAPSTLFGGGTWSNVSSEYAGLFERIEGGNAAAYGSTQTDAMRDIQGSFFNPGLKPYNNNGSYDGYYGAFGATYPFTGTTEMAPERGGYQVPRVTFKASSYLDASNIAVENRPVNATVRVWRLTAY